MLFTEKKTIKVTKAWQELSKQEKSLILAKSMVYFPELFSKKYKIKYRRFNELARENGLNIPNARDVFSSGGKKVILINEQTYRVPRIFWHLHQNFRYIIKVIKDTPAETLRQYWGKVVPDNRYEYWKMLVFKNGISLFPEKEEILSQMIDEHFKMYDNEINADPIK